MVIRPCEAQDPEAFKTLVSSMEKELDAALKACPDISGGFMFPFATPFASTWAARELCKKYENNGWKASSEWDNAIGKVVIRLNTIDRSCTHHKGE